MIEQEFFREEEKKCVAGCKNYYGGEIKHHKDCPFYPESFTEGYEQMEVELAKLKEENEILKKIKPWGKNY